MIPTPLTLYKATVHPDWLDYNNHMTEGYYGYLFGHASDALIDYARLDSAYRTRTNCTIYTAETHICFLRELPVNAPLHFTTHLLGYDSKRLHVFHKMFNSKAGYLAATFETMMLHVNQEIGRVTPMPVEIQHWLDEIAIAHSNLQWPEQVGRSIKMPQNLHFLDHSPYDDYRASFSRGRLIQTAVGSCNTRLDQAAFYLLWQDRLWACELEDLTLGDLYLQERRILTIHSLIFRQRHLNNA